MNNNNKKKLKKKKKTDEQQSLGDVDVDLVRQLSVLI